MKLTAALKELRLKQELHLEPHELDSCYFLLRDRGGGLHGSLIIHVDDLLIAAPYDISNMLRETLSNEFPISDWETGEFDYVGSQVQQRDGTITVNQESYVNSRLETIELPKPVNLDENADVTCKIDNQSTIGGLSWLASQTRPDLQAAVSLSQRKQKSPSYGDVKETNKAVKMAQAGKDESLRMVFPKLAGSLSQLMILLVFHDAAWAKCDSRHGRSGVSRPTSARTLFPTRSPRYGLRPQRDEGGGDTCCPGLMEVTCCAGLPSQPRPWLRWKDGRMPSRSELCWQGHFATNLYKKIEYERSCQ